MNILYIHSTPLDYQQANIIQVLNMCQAFAVSGAEVSLLIKASKNEAVNTQEWIKTHFGLRIAFRLIYFKSNFSIFGRFKELGILFSSLNKLVKEETKNRDFDFVYLRNPILLLVIKDKKMRVAFELHNNFLHPDSKVLAKLYEKLLLYYYKKNYIVKVITISEALKSFWVNKGILSSSVICHHDGFNSEHFKKSIDKCDAREELNIDRKTKVVTYTGSLYQDRGIELIIEAAKFVQDALFFVVGGPQKRVDHYKRQLLGSDITNIVFTGRVEQELVVKYLFASDILLLIYTEKVPTINYCSPLKLFEYMASGKIILGHSFPTITEVLTNGVNAILVEPNNVELFIGKLKETLIINNIILGKNARTEAFRKYSWLKRAQMIMEQL